MYIPLNLKEGLIDLINATPELSELTESQKDKILNLSLQVWCFIQDRQIRQFHSLKSYYVSPFSKYVNIHSDALSKYMTRCGDKRIRYTYILSLLEKGKYISINECYSNNAFPRSYKIETDFIKWPFTEIEFILPEHPWHIEKIRDKEKWLELFPDEKLIIETHYRTNINISKLDEYLYNNLGRCYKYNWENGIKTEVQLDYPTYMFYLNAAFRFKQKDFYFSRPDKSGRFYTSFNSLPKIVRQFCSIDEKSICEIDLKNAQPLFLSYLIEHSTFRRDCSLGQFWDKLARKIDKPREVVKVFVMKYIFYPKGKEAKSGKTYDALEELYEGLIGMIKEYKAENDMWNILQQKEAYFFVDCFKKHNIPFLPIHDSIAVDIQNAEAAKQLIEAELKREGVLGTFHKKCY